MALSVHGLYPGRGGVWRATRLLAGVRLASPGSLGRVVTFVGNAILKRNGGKVQRPEGGAGQAICGGSARHGGARLPAVTV
jgi:hypothetical protein